MHPETCYCGSIWGNKASSAVALTQKRRGRRDSSAGCKISHKGRRRLRSQSDETRRGRGGRGPKANRAPAFLHGDNTHEARAQRLLEEGCNSGVRDYASTYRHSRRQTQWIWGSRPRATKRIISGSKYCSRRLKKQDSLMKRQCWS